MVTSSEIWASHGFCYNSIELITVIYKYKNQWYNVITTLYCLQKEIKNEKEIDIYDSNNVKIIKIKKDFNKIYEVIDDLKLGHIKTHSFQINIHEGFDPDRSQVSQLKSFVKEFDDAEIFGVLRNKKISDKQAAVDALERMMDDTIRMGFKDTYDYIQYLTRIKTFSRNHDHDIYIISPFYVKIIELKIKNNEIKLKICRHESLIDLQVNLLIYEYGYVNLLKRTTFLIQSNNEINIAIESVLPDNMIEMNIFSRSLPQMKIVETLYVPVENPLKPFKLLFDQFFNPKEFEKHLLEPEKLDNKNRSSLFEKAVAHLFSLCGFSTIHLVEHEVLRLENKTEIGSADILAYDKNGNILLIDCDILNPDIKKMSDLHMLQRYSHDLPELEHIKQILPIIVTPIKYEKYDNEYGVIIIDNVRIKNLLHMINFKDEEDIINEILTKYKTGPYSQFI